ncbi:MAG: 3-hydroxyacyl-ACP dehydratase [Flavobacteriales bacterium]|nr:3-hydroxyacyl-ACP dehydratase [Flavobacteriales bacterium]
MLLNDFFTINSIEKEEGKVVAAVTIDKNHKIFDGHFPDLPVVPGVCLTQMVKEVLEELTGDKLMLTKGSNIKFMAVVDPQKNADLIMNLSYSKKENVWATSCITNFGETVAFKFKGEFTPN